MSILSIMILDSIESAIYQNKIDDTDSEDSLVKADFSF